MSVGKIKTAFISQPMKGKSREQILAERQELSKTLKQNGYIVLESVFNMGNSVNQDRVALHHLVNGLHTMAGADEVYFMNGWEDARGCKIERLICEGYGIPAFNASDYLDKNKLL